MERVDLPALQFVLVFSFNLIVGFIDANIIPETRTAGKLVLLSGFGLFLYVLSYLRTGFLGNTKPVLDHLITDGPYRFCRHPLYLCFTVMLFGTGLYLGSKLSIIYTVLVSVPSAVYRARKEETLLSIKFSESWDKYVQKVGLFYPKLKRVK
jgi:protein-S-isoprenylcysteine O-methyltransferase Ste14